MTLQHSTTKDTTPVASFQQLMSWVLKHLLPFCPHPHGHLIPTMNYKLSAFVRAMIPISARRDTFLKVTAVGTLQETTGSNNTKQAPVSPAP